MTTEHHKDILGYHRVGQASCRVRLADLPDHLKMGFREVYNLQTEPGHRKRGFATSLMHKLCREADQMGVMLLLNPRPWGCEGDPVTSYLIEDELQAWYASRFGFQVVQQKTHTQPMMMARMVGATPKASLRLQPTTQAAIEHIKHLKSHG